MKVGWLEIINIIMIFQLLLFTAFLFFRKTQYISNYIFGIHLFSQAAGIFQTLSYLQRDFIIIENPHLSFIGYPFVFLWGPTFYLYVKSIAYKDFKLRWKYILHIVPFIIILLLFSFTLYPNSAAAKRVILNDSSYFFFSNNFRIDLVLRIQIIFYIFGAYNVLFKVKKNLKENYSLISKTNLSWLEFIVFGYTVCYIISILSIYTGFYLKGTNIVLLLGSFIQFFIYFNIIFFKAWTQPEIFLRIEENVKYKKSKLTKEEAQCWINKLNEFVTISKPYLNPEITLNQLAEAININPKLLSQIINEYFNQNFYDYINRLRIEESKKMLLDSSNSKNVLEILYENGFNSKATFNRVFKNETGLSPTEFRKRNLKTKTILK